MLSNEVRHKVGALLKGERERQELSLEDIAGQLKISESNLTCIEEGDHSGLPSELYFALFAKSYAEALKIDYSRTLEAIEADIGPGIGDSELTTGDKTPANGETADGEPSDDTESSDDSTDLGNLKKLGWMAVIVFGLFVAYLGANEFLLGDGNATGEADLVETVSMTPAQAKDTESSALIDYDWTTPAINPPKPMKMKLLASRDCWATIFTDGDTALRQTLVAGRQYEVSANFRLQMWVANPHVLEVILNEKPLDLVGITDGRVNGLEINQANIESFLSPAPVAPSETNAIDEVSTGTSGDSPEKPETDDNSNSAQDADTVRIPLGEAAPSSGDST